MRILLTFFVLPLLLTGCLSGDFNAADQGVSVGPDMTAPRIFDLSGVDLFGAYNCVALNNCRKACTTKACLFMCNNMATPQAVQLDTALESCFTQVCPTDAGKVCAPDMTGAVSATCMMCINNSYIPQSASCTSTQFPDECHMCVQQANACTADM